MRTHNQQTRRQTRTHIQQTRRQMRTHIQLTAQTAKQSIAVQETSRNKHNRNTYDLSAAPSISAW
jgi:hypothetical protein